MQPLTIPKPEPIRPMYPEDITLHADKTIIAHYTLEDAGWNWYIIEHDGTDLCWGLVKYEQYEYQFFTMSFLETLRGPLGNRVERDNNFEPVPLKGFVSYHDLVPNSWLYHGLVTQEEVHEAAYIRM